MWAAWNGHPDLVKNFIKAGVDVNVTDNKFRILGGKNLKNTAVKD